MASRAISTSSPRRPIIQGESAGLAAVIQVVYADSGVAFESLNSGTVTLRSLTPSVTGDYSAWVIEVPGDTDGGQLSGTFDVPFCQIHH